MALSGFGLGGELSEWARRLQDMMDEMCKRQFVEFRDETVWQPATDVYETRDAYYICVDLAGMDAEDVDVECRDERRVCIGGYRSSPRPEGASGPLSVHAMEIDHGPFRREIDLPEPVSVDAVEATYDKGYLWIVLPKKHR